MKKQRAIWILLVLGFCAAVWSCNQDDSNFQSTVTEIIGIQSCDVIDRDSNLPSGDSVGYDDLEIEIMWQTRERVVHRRPPSWFTSAYALSLQDPTTNWKVDSVKVTNVAPPIAEDVTDQYTFRARNSWRRNSWTGSEDISDFNDVLEYAVYGLLVTRRKNVLIPENAQLHFEFWGVDSSYYECTTVPFTLLMWTYPR